MPVTVVGLVFVMGAVVVMLARRRPMPLLLSCGAALPSSAAVVTERNAVGPFALVAVVATVAASMSWIRHSRHSGAPNHPRPGWRALVLFTLWAVCVTGIGPVLFAGIPVLNPRRGVDAEVQFPSALGFTVSHLAQIAFLLVGVGVVFHLAEVRRSVAALPTVGFAFGTLLCSAQLLANKIGLRWPVAIFSNSPNIRYINFTPSGDPRFRGVFAEPSVLATFCITALAYFVCAAGVRSVRRRVAHLVLAGACLVNLFVSYAGTALVGGGLLVAAAVAVGIGRFVFGRARWHSWAVALGLVVLLVVAVAAPIVWAAAGRLVVEKLASDSFATRSASSTFSVRVFADTWGLGAGLGSNRPSSFPFMLISCVGAVGTILFVVAVGQLIRAAWQKPGYRPTAWALIAFFLAKGVAGANMSDPLMWLCIGVCAQAAWCHSRTESERPTACDGDVSSRAIAPTPHMQQTMVQALR